MRSLDHLLAPILTLAVLAATPHAQTCDVAWQPTFGGLAGTPHFVHAFATFDDGAGAGPQLYVGGRFASAGGDPTARYVARWDGSAWSGVGGGFDDELGTAVNDLAVFDDGGGPALYAAGSFQLDAASAADVARWDGARWSAVGSGANHVVSCLAVFDDGSGPALYAGGRFGAIDGVTAAGIARWDGSAWSAVGGGVEGPSAFTTLVKDLAVFDDGRGAALYAAGTFWSAGGASANHVARWDGSTWTPLGPGVGVPFDTDGADALAVFDDGGGPALYVGGAFDEVDGAPMEHMARWDGNAWSAVGGGVNGPVSAIATYDAGDGERLWITGDFSAAGGAQASDLAAWDGAAWSAPAPGLDAGSNHEGLALLAHDDGGGSRLFVGGDFERAGDLSVWNVTAFDGAAFAPLGGGGPSDQVFALAEADLGGGSALYAGGAFLHLGAQAANHIARWDGAAWHPLGSGIGDTVYALATFDDGSGPALYAGGLFSTAGGAPAQNVARWDGGAWAALPGAPLQGVVRAFGVFDLGDGPALFAGGEFPSPACIARWTGAGWAPLGPGITDGGPFAPSVRALAAYDDGTGDGPALYAGGQFYAAGGQPATRLARWDGSAWASVGGFVGNQLTDVVEALAVFDDGSGYGPELYVGGRFTKVGGFTARGVAKWNGLRWFAPWAGTTASVDALAAHDDGNGPALFAGGSFDALGAAPASRIARWNGVDWTAAGDGLDGVGPEAHALLSLQDGAGADVALVIAGDFATAGDGGDSFVASWSGCTATPSPWVHLGYALAPAEAAPPLLAGTGTLLAGSNGVLALTHAAPSAAALFVAAPPGTPAPFKGGTLIPVPPLVSIVLATDAAGEITVPFTGFPGGLSGLALDMQYAVQDAAAVHGVSLSNGLRAELP